MDSDVCIRSACGALTPASMHTPWYSICSTCLDHKEAPCLEMSPAGHACPSHLATGPYAQQSCACAEPASAGPPQQRPHAAAHAAAANIPSSPVPSTVRVAQQTLRKRDYESELLDRLLNSAQAAAPVQGEPASSCLVNVCSFELRRKGLADSEIGVRHVVRAHCVCAIKKCTSYMAAQCCATQVCTSCLDVLRSTVPAVANVFFCVHICAKGYPAVPALQSVGTGSRVCNQRR